MQHDEVIWQVINQGFCTYKVKAPGANFCRNKYNVTGLCNRSSCPLANSRYATVLEEKGTCYLYIKTIERAHLPAKMWERIKLSPNYSVALTQIDEQLQYWPNFNVHKCFGAGTKVMMYDGSTKAVEDITEGDLLMGDDSTPRRVLEGSLVHGDTATARAAGDATAATYLIKSKNAGRDEWTCNGHHTLVLRFNRKPSKPQKDTRPKSAAKPWSITVLTVENGRVKNKNLCFATEEEADEARADIMRDWQPITFECTVDEYLAMPKTTQGMATMFQPERVSFPMRPLAATLGARLEAAFGRAFEAASVAEAAWVLGMWLADGFADQPMVTQIREDVFDGKHHTEAVDRLAAWRHSVDGTPAAEVYKPMGRIRRSRKNGAPSNQAFYINLGPGFRRLLVSYGLLGRKSIPHDLLVESRDVRLALFAGLIDGDGNYHANHLYRVVAKERAFLDGIIHLGRGLGLVSGKVGTTTCTNSDTGEVYTGFTVSFGGDLHIVPVTISYKRAGDQAARGVIRKKDLLCDGFTVEKVADAPYYGFAVDGNARFLLGDFTVVHNCKQRLTKIHQYLIRMRKLKLKVRTKLVGAPKKVERREAVREAKAEKAARLDDAIVKELVARLNAGTYSGSGMYLPEKAYSKVLDLVGQSEEVEDDEEEEEEEEEGEQERELEGEDMEEEEEEGDEDDGPEFVADFGDSDDDDDEADLEDIAEAFRDVPLSDPEDDEELRPSKGSKRRGGDDEEDDEADEEEDSRPSKRRHRGAAASASSSSSAAAAAAAKKKKPAAAPARRRGQRNIEVEYEQERERER